MPQKVIVNQNEACVTIGITFQTIKHSLDIDDVFDGRDEDVIEDAPNLRLLRRHAIECQVRIVFPGKFNLPRAVVNPCTL